ncbi:DUF7146 domain-containing protein [Brevundimonas mediterranea]|jgi:hypothetical protein
MTLHAIVTALGGDLYQGGHRANVPAPGHSGHDRSVSLLLTDGRLVIHGFGATDWRAMRDDLRRRGFIDDGGRLTGGGHAGSTWPRPDRLARLQAAAHLWESAVPIGVTSAAARHIRSRSVTGGIASSNLRHHSRAPASVYRPGSAHRPALIARISDGADRLTGVELKVIAALRVE